MKEAQQGGRQTLKELTEQLQRQIINRLHLEGIVSADLDPDMPLFSEATGLDSIDALEIVVLLDKNYGIKITDSKEARKIMVTIHSLAEYVLQNRRK